MNLDHMIREPFRQVNHLPGRTADASRLRMPVQRGEVAVDGVRLAYVTAFPTSVDFDHTAVDVGHAVREPLVFLHGWAGTWTLWQATWEHFGGDHACVAFDLPSHGASDTSINHYGPGEMADAIAQALREFELSGATLVGHSLGTLVAVELALRHPDLVRRLVLSNPPELQDVRPMIRALGGDPSLRVAMRASRALHAAAGRMAPEWGGGRLGGYLRRVRSAGTLTAEGAVGTLRALEAALPMRGLEEIRVPTLVVGGRLDITTPRGHKSFAQRIPGADVVVFATLGHHPMNERPAAFNRAVREWMASTAAASEARSDG